tara:strand:- start:156774 stop:157064 length:291 start_codon:yes stop_codon:yes gene_type:complete
MVDSKTSNKISRTKDKLTIWHPFKQEVIDLNSDIKSWKLQTVSYLRIGKLYSLNIETKSGNWKKVFSRSYDGNFKNLVEYLEKTQPKQHKKQSAIY